MAVTIDSSIKSVLGASGLSISKIVQKSTGAVLWIKGIYPNSSITWSADIAEVYAQTGDENEEGIANVYMTVGFDVTNYSTITWIGNYSDSRTYGSTTGYLRAGTTQNGTNVANIKLFENAMNTTHNFSQTIDVSGISGNIYLSVQLEATTSVDAVHTHVWLRTTSIQLS